MTSPGHRRLLAAEGDPGRVTLDPREVVHFASDPALVIDKDLKVLAWNDGATDLLGYAAEHTLGRRCFEVLQAILPGGEPLCTPDCEGGLCFGRCRPFAVNACLARHRDGGWVKLGISTVVVPGTAAERGTGSVATVLFLRPSGRTPPVERVDQPLRVFTFGHFGVAHGDRGLDVDTWVRKHALTVLKYLVTRLGSSVHREQLIECVWPDVDETRGRERLKVTLHFLRRQLRAAGVGKDVIETTGNGYMLRRETVWVDAEAFERSAAEGWNWQRQGQIDLALRCYEDARHLYRGDYFEEDPYAEWCAEERERLREIFIEVLARMAEAYAERGRYTEAARACRIALVREPCREFFHRALMECSARLGRPDWAVNQFRRCRQVLIKELGVEPAAETCQLYRQVLMLRASHGQSGLNGRPDNLIDFRSLQPPAAAMGGGSRR